MQQLTGMDASFLALETANTTGHVGGLSVLDPSTAAEPLTLARLTEVMTERLPLVPVLRRKLLNVPLGLDQPYWIDDPDFDIEYHVREIALPRPGSDAQLTEQVSRLHARPLDRSRPLWELYLITGLARDRAAVYSKIHHAAVDGVSGTELLTVLFDLTPAGRELPAAEPFQPERPPPLPVLAAMAAIRLAWRPVQTVYPDRTRRRGISKSELIHARADDGVDRADLDHAVCLRAQLCRGLADVPDPPA